MLFTKCCPKCRHEKPLMDFPRYAFKWPIDWCRICREKQSEIEYNKRYYNKHRASQIERVREYTLNNKDRILKKKAAYRDNHRHQVNAASRKYYAEHSEERKLYSKTYRQLFPEKHRISKKRYREQHPEKQAEYFRMIRRHIPAWADKDKIRTIYVRARSLGMHVDHIVPIRSSKVCGLHTPDNLQIINSIENYKKNNRRWPDMP